MPDNLQLLNKFNFRLSHLLFFSRYLLDINIPFWEWHLNVIYIQCVIDTIPDIAFYVCLFQHVNPTEETKVDAVVAEVQEYSFSWFLGVNERVVEVVDCL